MKTALLLAATALLAPVAFFTAQAIDRRAWRAAAWAALALALLVVGAQLGLAW